VGWRIRGSSMCPLAADRGKKCRAIYVYISFLRAVVVVLVVSVIVLIHYVVVIFFLRMHVQQAFSALFTGVSNTIACICRKRMYEHAHALHVEYSDVSPGVGTRHLESPEEIQMYCSDSIHIYRAVYELHVYMYILVYK